MTVEFAREKDFEWWNTTPFQLRGFTSNSPLKVVQLTDLHLYADTKSEYYGANCHDNFQRACQHVQENGADLVILTGDVTNDHTEASYQRVSEIVRHTLNNIVVAWLPGNHDDISLMQQYFSGEPFISHKHLVCGLWQLFLMNSKSETPAGFVSPTTLEAQQKIFTAHQAESPFSGAFMHHHPIKMNAYIDKHICENGDEVLAALSAHHGWKFLAHGHVHTEQTHQFKQLTVLATPATSVQFGQALHWEQINTGPQYRTFHLFDTGEWDTEVIALDYEKRDANGLNEGHEDK